MPVNLVLLNAYTFASIIQTDWLPFTQYRILLCYQNFQTVSAAADPPSHQISYEEPEQWKLEANCPPPHYRS
jgi:hypothetical protein